MSYKITLDDFIDEGPVTNNEYAYKPVFDSKGMLNDINLCQPIIYNVSLKRFIPGRNLTNKLNAFLGWVIKYDKTSNLVDVLYRGFLFKDPVKISTQLQQKYIQEYVYGQFEQARDSIIENMPRIKKLKRINLKMITKQQALFIYRNFDSLIDYYEMMYGHEKSMFLKSQIATSPFYVNDNGTIKIYDMQTNELKTPDLETEAYFLAYFTFLNK